MAEAWVDTSTILEHADKLRRSMFYFRLELLSAATFALMAHSRKRRFGIFKRRALDIQEANRIVLFLNQMGAPRPRWYKGDWPPDVTVGELGVMSVEELYSIEELCDNAVHGKIRMTSDEMARLTGYRDLKFIDQKAYERFMQTDMEEFFDFISSNVEELDAQIKQNEERQEEARHESEGAFSEVKCIVDCLMTLIMSLIFGAFTLVFALREDPAAWFSGVLSIIAFVRTLYKVRQIRQFENTKKTSEGD